MGIFNFGKPKPASLLDAKKVLSSVNEEAIRSAWDIYAHIKKNHTEQYDEFDEKHFKKLTYSWEGLKKIVEKNGDFKSFTEKEHYLLLAVRDGHLDYADIIHVLIDHHDDEEEAKYLYEHHPRLHKVIPKQYDNASQIIEVLLEYVKQYQWHLEHYSMKYYGKIEEALGEAYDDEQIYVSKD